MHFSTVFSALALGSAVQGAPTSDSGKTCARSIEGVCGPDTNCEVVEKNGLKSYKFKSGFEPGSDDYIKRFANRKRGEDGRKTKITIGDTRSTSESGAKCDEGSDFAHEVQWTNGGFPKDVDVMVTASGTYENKEQRDNLIHAIKATVTEDTIDQKEVEWSGNNGLSPGLVPGTCQMNRFANYIGVAVFSEDGNIVAEMSAKLENEENGSGACDFMWDFASTITGAVNGIAGSFFGLVSMGCD